MHIRVKSHGDFENDYLIILALIEPVTWRVMHAFSDNRKEYQVMSRGKGKVMTYFSTFKNQA